jgi:1-acyl-sn-glycerol-3-phosphate acyltransferase
MTRTAAAAASPKGYWFYWLVVTVCRFPFWVSSRPVVLHAERAARRGPYLLASNHLSPYDVPALMRFTPRALDFVSTVEVFRNPFAAWLYSRMGTFPLDRSRRDVQTVRIIIDRLERGRVVAMFPEGRVRAESESVIHGAPFKARAGKIATMAKVPIVPAVVLGSKAYSRSSNWLPLRRVRYGVAYGEAIEATDEAEAERQLAEAFKSLYAELRAAMEG